ncbi:MAG: hypothetical protein E6J82_09365 [Deltaproteobacteria bacterium]|nr:MAG: hypothetical protein E6J82_09365 [Deltaproteobacteria bacterium]
MDEARHRLQGQGLPGLPDEGRRCPAARNARRSRRCARAPRARVHVQGRRPPQGSGRGVPPVPRSPSRRRRPVDRAGRHLLPAGGIAAHAVIWSVSVDLDGLGCYAAIHGLPLRLDERAQRAVPAVGVQRFCELFAAAGVRATFFVIGREAAIAPGALKAAAAAGHEIGSHSYRRISGSPSAPSRMLAGKDREAFALRATRSRRDCSTPSASAGTPMTPRSCPAFPITRRKRRLSATTRCAAGPARASWVGCGSSSRREGRTAGEAFASSPSRRCPVSERR